MSLRLPAATLQPTLGLAGLGLLVALPATAQTPPAAVALPEIGVAAEAPSPYRRETQQAPRLPTTIEETPQSISVVTKEVIQERGASSVREALRNVTGISLAAGEGGFSGDNLTLRGFSARGDFFIDGIRDVGQYTRDPFFLDSIEVLKGPSSVAFGRGSTGGVINQTSRLPQNRNFGELWLSAYSPRGLRSTGDVNMAIDNVAVRVAAMGSKIEASRRDHVEQSRWGVAPSVTWGINGPTQVTLSYLHQEEDNVPDYGLPYIGGRPARVPLSNFYGVSGLDRERTTTDVATMRVSHRFDDALTIRNTTRWGNYERHVNATAPRILTANAAALPLESIIVRREPQVRDGLDTILVNQTEALLRARTGPVSHNLLAGFEIGRESSEVTRYSFPANANGRPNTSLLYPNYYAGTATIIRNVASDVRTVANTYAFYAVDQMKFGEMFELLLGGRWDSFDADYRNRTNRQNFGRTDEAFSWRTALVFKPVRSVRSYFAYGTSFNPSAESLTLAANNAQLPPEENETYELGASWEALDGVRLTGSLFRIEKKNARTSDPAGNLQVLDGVTRVDGFEIGAVGRITRDWNLLFGYTHLKSEIIESRNPAELGKEFVNAAPNTVALWTTYNLPHDLQLGGGLSYVDYRYGNTTNTNRVPAYTRYDLAAAWAPTEGPMKGLRMQVNALNITDAKTYETVYTAHTVPGTGRTLVFSVAARF